MTAACSGWRRAAKRNSEWIAASRALRVRALLPRSCSRWSRNAPISGGVEVADVERGRAASRPAGRGEGRAAAGTCRGRRRWCAGWRVFWRISRSVKNACRVGASGAHGWCSSLWLRAVRRPARAAPGRRTGSSSAGWPDVPEIGRQQRQAGLHVAAVAVPVEQGGDREASAADRARRPAARPLGSPASRASWRKVG